MDSADEMLEDEVADAKGGKGSLKGKRRRVAGFAGDGEQNEGKKTMRKGKAKAAPGAKSHAATATAEAAPKQ